jgi:hypothetical protein
MTRTATDKEALDTLLAIYNSPKHMTHGRLLEEIEQLLETTGRETN